MRAKLMEYSVNEQIATDKYQSSVDISSFHGYNPNQ